MNRYIPSIALICNVVACLAMKIDPEKPQMNIVETYGQPFNNPEFQNAMDGRGEIPVERNAYLYLKENPLMENVTYVPAPFYHFLYNHKMSELSQTIDSREGEQSRFTITHVEHPKRLLPLLHKWGIKVLFAVNAKKDDLVHEHYGITIKPFPYSPMVDISPSKYKNILYSFVGTAVTCPELRNKIFNMKHPKESKVIERKSWGHTKDISPQEKKNQTEHFQDILASSRFSLCPRGEGPQTIRFYESLKAGAIPVVIADTATFPEAANWSQSDWQKCMITVPENDVDNMNHYLDIGEEKEAAMRKKCYEASKCFEGENLVAPVRHYYNENSKDVLRS